MCSTQMLQFKVLVRVSVEAEKQTTDSRRAYGGICLRLYIVQPAKLLRNSKLYPPA